MTTDHSFPFSSLAYQQALFGNPKQNAILLINSKGIIEKANRAFLLSFGYAGDDLIGQHLSILFTEEDQKKDMAQRELDAVLTVGQSNDNNYLLNKNQSRTWVSGESVMIKNEQGEKYILKIIQNIHIQKESENSIVRLNNFNENILSSIEDIVVALDADFKIMKVNSAFNTVFNIPGEEVAKLNFNELLKSWNANFDLSNIVTDTISSGKGISKLQVELDLDNLNKKIFDISCSKLDMQDGQTNILLVFHDITSQKQFEKQREDILNFVAHELRNPITNVSLSIELLGRLLEERKMDEFHEHIARSKNGVQRLNKLIKELYNSAKLSSGVLDIEWEAFDFNQMINESINTISEIYPNYTIEKKMAPAIIISGDRDKLIQVVTNYLTNAIKYSDKNAPIQVEVAHDGNSIVFSVRDYGIGIPSSDLPFIFNRFFRAEKTKNLEGLGLGLFLCKQIIISHSGLTWVESEEGKGSVFYFSLPVNKPE